MSRRVQISTDGLGAYPDAIERKVRAFAAGTDKMASRNAKNHLIAGSPRQRPILERLEPYEGKLSRTVLRGA